MTMDAIDRAIVSQLTRNAQISNTELAERVGLSPSPCLRRVRRLEQDGVILGYHARIAPKAIGQGFEVFAQFELDNQRQETIERFESALIEFPEVIEAHRMFGSPDVVATIRVADIEGYERFATEKLRTLPGLTRMSSRFSMKVLKSRYPEG
ncbi:AsnC family transcriptional regulator [Microcella alkaliphila]|uniref:AsnC family transcriptional regulator n=2 Tax=Microcella alkaliphila TaxID=279828 RepID=A0A4V6MBU3_9MICO|nr:AsnC family transcriptional regulator [Microcella alkaliphila]